MTKLILILIIVFMCIFAVGYLYFGYRYACVVHEKIIEEKYEQQCDDVEYMRNYERDHTE